jgi:hypothetical protein
MKLVNSCDLSKYEAGIGLSTKYWSNQPLSTLDEQTQYFDAAWPDGDEKYPVIFLLHG